MKKQGVFNVYRRIVNLQSDLKPINVTFASIGLLNEAMVHPREMLKASIMIINSHPSGNLLPSKQDIYG